jgi:hypothetical protein
MSTVPIHQTHHVATDPRGYDRATCIFCHACSCHRPNKLRKPCPVEYVDTCGLSGCDNPVNEGSTITFQIDRAEATVKICASHADLITKDPGASYSIAQSPRPPEIETYGEKR